MSSRVFRVLFACLLLAGLGCSEEPKPSEGGGPDAGAPDAGDTRTITGEASQCTFDVAAGDHTFSCQGVTFLTVVDASCLDTPCGLIVDVHGGTMSGAQMRDNTLLHQLAPSKGFIVVHPSATAENTGGFWTADHYPIVANFLKDLIAGYEVDEDRVHFTGFSQGGAMTWWFLCEHPEMLASAAPTAAAFEEGSCFDASWQPRVPILFMNGVTDAVSQIETSRTLMDSIAGALSLTGGEQVAGSEEYTQKRWSAEDGMVLEYIEHNYGGQAVLAGHCIPGGVDISGAANNFGLNATTCTTGGSELNWGELVLQWFIDHPRAR